MTEILYKQNDKAKKTNEGTKSLLFYNPNKDKVVPDLWNVLINFTFYLFKHQPMRFHPL